MSNPRQDIHDQIWSVLKEQNAALKAQAKQAPFFRMHLWEVLEQGRGRGGRMISWFLFLLILVSLFSLPIDFISSLNRYQAWGNGLEIFVTIVFTTEYFLRIYAAPSRWRYILSWRGIFDLVAVVPYYLVFLAPSASVAELLKLTKILRLLKVMHIKSLEDVEDGNSSTALSHVLDLIPGEKIEKIALKHPLFFMINLVVPIVLGGVGVFIIFFSNFQIFALLFAALLFLFAFIFFYKAWIDYYYDVIYITNYRVVFQDKHIFGHSLNQVEYRSITNICPSDTGIFSTLFGFGKILIETSNEQVGIEDRNIREYQKVAQFIQQKCHAYTEAQERR